MRDERWLLHNSGAFYDLGQDPLEKKDLRLSTDPEAAAARAALTKALAGLPADGPAPFPGFRGSSEGGEETPGAAAKTKRK